MNAKLNRSATAMVEGHLIQQDRSGVGHDWVVCTADTLPADILAEIECAYLAGDLGPGAVYTASNGLRYRLA